VVGILPPGVSYDRADVLIPYYINPDSLTGRASNFLSVVARLKPGITVAQAHRELNALTKTLVEKYPRAYPASMQFGATAISLRTDTVGNAEPALLILLGAVGLVLLIACANVANLLLARGEARQREIAVRLALGAGRRRVITQLLTESMVLAFAGAATGSALAWWGVKAILAMSPGAIPRAEGIQIDVTVGLVTLGLALLTGFLFGLAPALQLAKPDVQSTLREGTRGGTEGRGRQRFGKTLVAGEIALAVVVVVGATLLVRSFSKLQSVDPGFNPKNILAVSLALPQARYDSPATLSFYARLMERVKTLPGAKNVAVASDLPPRIAGNNWDILIEGRPSQPGVADPSPQIRFVTREYFDVIGEGVATGRTFTEADHATSEPVAVINETASKVIWPKGDALGARIRFSSRQPWMTIVGIVRDVRSQGLATSPPAEVYMPYEQSIAIAGGAQQQMFLVMRTSTDPMSLAPAARGIVRELDPLLAITSIRSMDDMISVSVASSRFAMRLLATFGLLALALAAIGVYGLMSYGVKRRTREIGIRLALGAQRGDVMGLVVRQGMTLAVAGLVAGIAVAAVATRYMGTMLFGVTAYDPVTFGGVVILLCIVALVASWVPARRAVKGDTSEALRGE
jgi:putative ABC transport system permease protein